MMVCGWAVGTNTWSLLSTILRAISVLLPSNTFDYNVRPSNMKSTFCYFIAGSTMIEFSTEIISFFCTIGITRRRGCKSFDEDVAVTESNSTGFLNKCSKLAALARASRLFLTPLTCCRISSLLLECYYVLSILRDCYISLAYFFMI